jgi:F-type H+-transporting ATPase subunit alpha
MVELLKQDQFTPRQLAEQVALIFAGTKGYLDAIPVEQIRKWERDFLGYMHKQEAKIMAELAKGGKIENELEKNLISNIEEFNKTFLF